MSSLARYPLELIVRSGGQQLARCAIKRGHYILGHHEASEIVVDEPSISGRHARFTVMDEDEIYLEDLRSANGTFVDGQPAEACTRIYFTSFVQVANATVEFQRAGLPAAVFDYLPESFLHPKRYQPGGLVVRGGVSTIVSARDLSLERPVAVRTMQAACQRSASTVIRFIREAQIMGQLQHPNIPPVHELRLNDDGQLLYTTRLLEGESLGSILERLRSGDPATAERWSLHALLAVWQKACDAVAYAHAHGVIHCALRPEHLLAGDFGEVLVIGWTFAIVMEDADAPAAGTRVRAPGEAASASIDPYTAPEVAIGMGIFDERIDVYALGAILYALLALKPPFPATDERHLVRHIIDGNIEPPPLRSPGGESSDADARFREGLSEIVMRALSASAESRPASVLLLQAEVAAWQGGLVWAESRRRNSLVSLLQMR